VFHETSINIVNSKKLPGNLAVFSGQLSGRGSVNEDRPLNDLLCSFMLSSNLRYQKHSNFKCNDNNCWSLLINL